MKFYRNKNMIHNIIIAKSNNKEADFQRKTLQVASDKVAIEDKIQLLLHMSAFFIIKLDYTYYI